MSEQENMIRVWDPFVRFFHWSLVLSYAVAWATAEESEFLHEQAGYFMLILLTLRIVWGVVGSRYARFSSFITGLQPVKAYLRSLLHGRPTAYTGHNPAGGWMIVTLILILGATVISGIQMQGMEDSLWEEIHEFFANLSVLLVVVHVSGVLLSGMLHNENLVKAMWTGKKRRNDNV